MAETQIQMVEDEAIRRSPLSAGSTYRKVAFILGAVVAYALMFELLYPVVGGAIAPLSVLPAVAAGWLLGLRAGLLVGLLMNLLNLLLFSLVMELSGDHMPLALPSIISIVVTGAMTGWLKELLDRMHKQSRDLVRERESLKKQIAERKQVEEKLQAMHRELEMRVYERTAELVQVNQALEIEINEHNQAEAALDQAHARLQHILATSPTVIYSCQIDPQADPGSGYPPTFISYNITRTFGYEIEECLGNTRWWFERVHPEDAPRIIACFSELFTHGHYAYEYRFRHKDGSYRWVRDQLILVRDDAGQPMEFVGSWVDITENKRIEEQIKTSLQEKEVLLKEIHHRVKNNLQIISSLLNLQSGYINDQQTLEIFQDSQNRIRSMALIHEKLYQSQDLARIDLVGYIQNLTGYLFRSYSARAGGISLNIQADEVLLEIDAAVPCGLILNELISNSLKHAFPNGHRGEILIELRTAQERQLTLIVDDNGIGLPPDMDFRETTSLGLQLVNALVDQLEGTISLHRNGGTRFEIAFSRSPITKPQ